MSNHTFLLFGYFRKSSHSGNKRFITLLWALTILIVATPGVTAIASDADGKSATPTASVFSAANPFYDASKLLYQAPPFDKIKDSDYAPALEEGMRRQRQEIDAIATNPEPPTFENTIVAMERTGALLTRVSKVFFNLTQSNTDDAMQKIEEDMAPKLSQHRDAIFLDAKLFGRVKAVYDQRAELKLDPESDHLVERYYQLFVRAGAQLSEEDKAKMRTINERLATLATDFGNNVLASTASGAVVIDDLKQLDGLSDGQIAGAADAAKQRHLDGKWLLPLMNTTTQPVLTYLKDRALRERIFKASTSRSDTDGANDNRALIAEMAQLRAERAKLLGYPNFAAYSLEDQMAKTPEAATDLMTRVAAAAVVNARAEAAKIQALIDQQAAASNTPSFKLEPWDWDFYAEQVRKAEYDLDESQISQYFELDRVLHDGLFFAAKQLYGLTFKERKDLPVYQPDVRVFEIFDANGKSIGLIYLDYFARDNKQGGAWMDSFVDQSDLLHQRPVVYNVCNFPKPAPGQADLMSFDDVTGMFHEFGHALHGFLSKTRYPLFSGAATPNDFAEFPSQFNENWALEPKVFANYARHYKTGAAMPDELVQKIKKSRTFNQGYATTEYVAAALLDMAWHELPADAPKQDPDTFEAAALQKYGVAVDEVPPRYRSTYFQHIWNGGYPAGYYSYLWTDVIAQDAFAWFTENGGMTRANGQHFVDTVLSRGGTKDAHQLYLDFRGKEPEIEPYLKKKGLTAIAPQQH